MSMDPTKLAVVIAVAKERHRQQDKLDAEKAAHEQEIRRLSRAVDNKPAKAVRQNDQTEVFRAAIREASTPNDARSALITLRQFASSRRFPQLIGHVPGEGFQWSVGAHEWKLQTERNALAAIKRQLKKVSR